MGAPRDPAAQPPAVGPPAEQPPAGGPGAAGPVARVALDVPLSQLDRPFDYLVPPAMADLAVPGARVRAVLAGRKVGGFVLARLPGSDHGPLRPLSAVVSPEPVLAPDVADLARAVADRCAGTLADVLRLAVPPRHARAERTAPGGPAAGGPAGPAAQPPAPPGPGPWAPYPGAAALLDGLGARPGPRAAWTALPGVPWQPAAAELVARTLAAGRGALVVVPDAADLRRADAALTARLGPGRHAVLSADAGPERRYRTFLAVRRGAVRAVLGTRAAVFAPVADLGLALLWDDGDDALAEPRAPYPHARDVLALRAARSGCALVLGGTTRTVAVQALVEAGWLAEVAADRATVRAAAPAVRVAEPGEGARGARVPPDAARAARAALAAGPVLVQVPRRGYVPGLACQDCREPAACAACGGPLVLAGARSGPLCARCATPVPAWSCPWCGGRRLRARRVGAGRTAEELARAFPAVPVLLAGGDRPLASVDAAPALVVATPGSEPVADGGYAGALLLDGRLLLERPDLRAAEDALRRWAGAAALVRPGGPVVLVAPEGAAAAQALVRWDPAGFAARELAERRSAGLPPARRVAELVGPAAEVAALLAAAALPPGSRTTPAVPLDPGGDAAGDPDRVRVWVSVDRGHAAALPRALKAALVERAAVRRGPAAAVRMDPATPAAAAPAGAG